VNRMTDEISSLLGFSKHREVLRPVYVQLSEILERAVQNVKVLPEFETVKITYADPDQCIGWFDPAKVERVLLNLIFNACEAVCPVSGEVEVVARASAGGMAIQVSDNGPGIPDSIRDSLFQPFVSHGKEKGIGLGLTVVQKIMHDHGGKVSILKTGPQGTTFELTFPTPSLDAKSAPQGTS
jgi:signal transduction histidine kinase